MEDNNNVENLEFAEPKQDFEIVKVSDNFEIKKDVSENIASTLAEKTTAKLVGTFTTKKAGKQKLTAIFKYGEGDAVKVFTETEVIAVKLVIKLDKPTVLPKNLAINSEQEVEFLINNPTEFEATKIKLEGIEGLVDISIIKEKPKNDGDYEVVGNTLSVEDFNKGSEVKLDAKHRFRIKAKIKTDEAESTTLKLLVKYHELEYLEQADVDKEGAKFEQTVDVQAIKVIGEVTTKLPAKIKLGSEYEVVFQFINENTEFSATGVNITVTEEVTTEKTQA
jgi:hypothetical protein